MFSSHPAGHNVLPLKHFNRGHAALVIGLLSLLTVSFLVLAWSKSELRAEKSRIRLSADRPPLYLPEARYIKLVTLGFDTFASRILWFSTVNYFGKRYIAGQDYRWLYSMCKLVTRLDENATHVFEFCGTLLSWMAKEPVRSNEILTHAIEAHPRSWRFRYLRGFNYWYFLSRPDLAKEDFKIASKLPNAPKTLASLAGRLMVSEGDPQTAINFLEDLIQNTEDPNARKALGEKRKQAIISRDKRILEKAVAVFEKQHHRKPEALSEMVDKGVLNRLPKEPYGGHYLMDPATGEIKTSSGKKGLEFMGRTAKTGVFKKEFEQR
jgi:hypothetical protein